MAKKCDHSFLTLHSGTEQSQRLKKALLPSNFNLNDFSIEEWMAFAFNFAKEVNYFSTNNDTVSSGNWEAFFIEKETIAAFVSEIEKNSSLTPHLTLFVTFLKLLDLTKQRFNKITERHLHFYYEEILQIQKKEATEDQVHLLFELAKNAEKVLIKKETLLEAGKDTSGKRMQYNLDEEQVFNKARIAELKSVYHHRKTNNLNPLETHCIVAAAASNTKDGQEEPLEEGDTWLPFGFPKYHNAEVALPTATLGFAIAAPNLLLKEGRRLIQLEYTFNNNIGAISLSQALACIDIYATGEKGWLGPFKAVESIEAGYTSSISGKKLTFALEIDKTEEAIVPFNTSVHTGNYNTRQPLLLFQIKTEFTAFEAGYQLFTSLLEKKIDQVKIEVKVTGVTSLTLKNDVGTILPGKPFFPFGTQPVKRSSFYIDYEELFQKKWNSFSIDTLWLNTPNNFKDYYAEYDRDDNDISVTGDSYFTTKVLLNDRETLKSIDSAFQLFQKNGDLYENQLSVSNTNYTTGENGPLKLSLNTPFFHSEFPKIYALELLEKDNKQLPNTPYTPQIESIELSYTASQEVNFKNNTKSGNLAEIQLFHIHPFGQSETRETLIPTYCKGGELYIGLQDAEVLQQVTILFQLLEGTENPLTEAYVFPDKIEWSVLCKNTWLELDSNHLIKNGTNNFLKTGLVTIVIPKQATTQNTILPEGYIWVRAKTDKNFDAFCQVLNIHAQVGTATFLNQKNDLSHLLNGLPANTIAKLTERDALVKKVSQPYNSFGGKPEETSTGYYKRVSERLRHKDRAINQWDYEHLILQKFTEVYKVKCLNHTQGENYQAPGYVDIVVIPDIVDNNAFDIYQPRLSTAKRNEIQAYINTLNSFFITAQIINPEYEEIEISCKVKFHIGYDENYYVGEVEDAIKKYLSPWAFEETNSLNFGITFHRSKIIQFLEQLEYVDFLEDVQVKHRKNIFSAYQEKVNVIPTSPKAILVSAKKHYVTAIQSKCYSPTPKTVTPCLP
ncbi:MAG: baseplate J/gp47 family protein [Flavobacteriaceae bacterium]|nr:baseplate J/gp47 family protein [Flavobacteriaceae bacterium]